MALPYPKELDQKYVFEIYRQMEHVESHIWDLLRKCFLSS